MPRSSLQQFNIQRDYGIIQQIIYFFNEHHVRDYVIELFLHHLYPSAPFSYLGTFEVKQFENLDKNDLWNESHSKSLKEMIEERIKKAPKHYNKLFTICLQYEDAKVHFVSFVYEVKPVRIVSFDSGSNLYLVGERIIVPTVISIFQELHLLPPTKSSRHHIGVCSKRYFSKRFGLQFSGENPLYNSLPADAFCQSWSLYFITEWIRRYHPQRRQHGEFVKKWCKIIPKEREWFILSTFFLPLLTLHPYLHSEFQTFYPETHICAIRDYLLEDKWIQVQHPIQKKKTVIK